MLRGFSVKTPYNLLFVLIFFTGVRTEALSVSIESSIDTTIATIGDRVHLNVRMRYPADVRFVLPQMDKKLGEWDLIGQQLSEPEKIKDGFRQNLTLELTVFDTGKVVVPPIHLQAVSQVDSSDVMDFQTDEFVVDVITVLPPGTTEPKDIKPPFAIRSVIPWTIVIFIVLIIAIIVAWWVFYRRWRQKQLPAALDEDFLEPPHITAFRKLEELKNQPHPTEEDIRRYYFQLSEILREYLERRYFIKALEMTTREIMDSFRETGDIAMDIQVEFQSLFNDLDLVKFAKFIPEPGNMITAWEQTYKCIDNTKREPFLNRRSS